MGNVNMEAKQIHDRTEAGKHQSVADHLKALDAIAATIEDMPAYTSSDRAWLDEWENKLPELPADPETDGVKVLTATTTNGETVKSWEEQQGGGSSYSTTETIAGEWNGKTLYRRLFTVGVSSGVEWNSTLDESTPVDFACLEFGYIDNAAAERRYYSCNSYIDGSNRTYAYAGVQNGRLHLYHRIDGSLFAGKQLTVSILYTKSA